ncbi:hypothetical protein BU14_0121s0045 [Porphyra umbilicalis]|uniref:Uncharacterized protein n=1 Tax=Porphyra umbilicalis TaxID=2786 RepID=A0A1X6PBB1_PORUM|nr:hypothetical protein BU14_0121s0045 [Porphyra umbilicalis]|eukprot:OSX78117.1 hypothetical protein BU14_0121s0045 [Porphyra umbilicalis]
MALAQLRLADLAAAIEATFRRGGRLRGVGRRGGDEVTGRRRRAPPLRRHLPMTHVRLCVDAAIGVGRRRRRHPATAAAARGSRRVPDSCGSAVGGRRGHGDRDGEWRPSLGVRGYDGVGGGRGWRGSRGGGGGVTVGRRRGRRHRDDEERPSLAVGGCDEEGGEWRTPGVAGGWRWCSCGSLLWPPPLWQRVGAAGDDVALVVVMAAITAACGVAVRKDAGTLSRHISSYARRRFLAGGLAAVPETVCGMCDKW